MIKEWLLSVAVECLKLYTTSRMKEEKECILHEIYISYPEYLRDGMFGELGDMTGARIYILVSHAMRYRGAVFR